MAKKISNEMVEALKTAKSPEDVSKVLNAEGFDIQELSLDDLEHVSGGFTDNHDGTITIEGIVIDEASFNSLFLEIERASGFDVAFNQFCAWTGYDPHSVDGGSNCMDVVLHHFWKKLETGGGY